MPFLTMQDREETQQHSSQQRRSQLPPLAPRHSSSSSSRDRTSASASGRPPRLSHRSRAGCWTCRARKVKCDEVHPKCGPCTRLKRECDWDHRWNFSDATPSTQVKYKNVTTTGNAVWDPRVRDSPSDSPISHYLDELPAFAVLTTDDERERKAEFQRPGTFGVVVTPESFSDLPEYAAYAASGSRRLSVQSHTSNLSNRRSNSSLGRGGSNRNRADPNVVVLERFEDVSLSFSGAQSIPSEGRRTSLPDGISYLSISAPAPSQPSPLATSPLSQVVQSDAQLIAHFRHYVLPRLIQPQFEIPMSDALTNATRDMFEVEAPRFHTLHQAICAVSALNLSYNGRATMEEALQHYHQALSSQTSFNSTDDLLSDGAFLRHYLLFTYDISIPMDHEEGGSGMWAIHLNQLQRIATLRNERPEQERLAYLVWAICELDMYACLLGSGNCDFFRNALQNEMIPPLHQQIPLSVTSSSGPFLANELAVFPAVLSLNQGVTIQLANIAQIAQKFRQEAADRHSISPGLSARWQSTVAQLQADLTSFWAQSCPEYLASESHQAGQNLPPRVRWVFEHALILYHTATIYSRTSMYLHQRRITSPDTERRAITITTLASTSPPSRRHVLFPLFLAGVATAQPDVKMQALEVMKGFEGSGLGQNTQTMRRLLGAVYEEQRRRVEAGGRMEEVDWLEVSRETGLRVVNCGL